MLTWGGGAADTTSMVSSTGHFARREIRRRRRAFRKHWPLVAAITLGLSAVTGLVLALILGGRVVQAWVLGPVVVIAAFWALRPQLDGTYLLQSGIEAESWTSRDLRKGLGKGWHVIDWISFGDQGDVDHVVIGPSGVFAVESKYTDSTLDSRVGRKVLERWIEQSHDGARRVRLLLKHHYGQEVEVSALVVVSGSASLSLPADAEGIAVVRRRNLADVTMAWRSTPPRLPTAQIEAIRAGLLEYRGVRDAFERNHIH
jgi:hypothetical protein